MGLLVEGEWHDKWYDTKSTGGKFVRKPSQFRNWITGDGRAGPTGEAGFEAEGDRYHLYVSYACPWAHRTLIFRALKGLEDTVSVSVVHPYMGREGWTFDKDFTGTTGDPVNKTDRLYEIYLKANPNYSGRVTVPVLWDKKRATIVNNESAEIIRMFNSAFVNLVGEGTDFYPAELQAPIHDINALVYDTVNNGVYRCGFATSQDAYDVAFRELFATLDKLEARLSRQRYLVGDNLTEADWRLFTTLVRFDPVYYGHFKCNKRRIQDYPNLWTYVRDLYQVHGVAETVHLDHIKHHYYASHKTINPTGIVPLGPDLDYTTALARARVH